MCTKFLLWPYISAFHSLPSVRLIQMNGQLAQGHTDTQRWVYHLSVGSQKGVKRMEKKASGDTKGSGRKRWMQRMEEKREKEERNRGPPKWLWSCIKLVMSVIRGKSAAEACSIRGEMVTLRPLLLFCHSSLIAPLCSLSHSSSKARLARLIRSSLPHSKSPDILDHRRCLHRNAGFPKTPCKLLALM